MSMLSLKFTPEKTDYVNAARGFMQKSNENLAWFCIALYFPLTLIYVWLIWRDASFITPAGLMLLIFGLPVFFIFPIFLSPVRVDEMLFKPTEWTITDNSLLISTPIVNANFEWATFSKVMESADHYILVRAQNKNIFHILPKRAFENPDSENSFREFMKAKYGDISTTSVKSGSKLALRLLGALYLLNIFLLFYSNLRVAF